jgi:hypothetical protein
LGVLKFLILVSILPLEDFVNIDFSSKIALRGLTFDDVLMIPDASSVLPSQVSLSTTFADNFELSLSQHSWLVLVALELFIRICHPRSKPLKWQL